jgi:hypothetical protein
MDGPGFATVGIMMSGGIAISLVFGVLLKDSMDARTSFIAGCIVIFVWLTGCFVYVTCEDKIKSKFKKIRDNVPAEIKSRGGDLVAYVGRIDELVRDGWAFTPYPEEPLQWGIGKFTSGHKMARHRHLERDRIPRHVTQEFFYVAAGSAEFYFYEAEDLLAMVKAATGTYICIYSGGHKVTITSPGTVILEKIKRGIE